MRRDEVKAFANDNPGKRGELINNEVFTTTEAAVMMGCSGATVRKLVDTRRINSFRSHTNRGKRIISRKDLFDFMDANNIEIFTEKYEKKVTKEQRAMELLGQLVAWSEGGNASKNEVFAIVDKAKHLIEKGIRQ